ncbi:MAG TPA: hypothetical protein PK405_08140 [Hyphomicrobiales bacterium]|nr:hypothetical protein [Rhodobiaceae bacterium]HXK54639.1 hypothetical protein [Hyphomicrobiales bacterium]
MLQYKKTISDDVIRELIARTKFIISQLEGTDAEFIRISYQASMNSLSDFMARRGEPEQK